MAPRSNVALVLLHGVPETEDDPFKPLALLSAALSQLVPRKSSLYYDWRPELADRNLTRLALQGQLGREAAIALGPRLAAFAQQHTGERLVLGGYSAGGWIIYHWLTEASAQQQWLDLRQRIHFVFTVGSPHRNVRKGLYLGQPPRLMPAREWALEGGILARAIATVRLHCVISLADKTVWPDNAAFLPEWPPDPTCADPPPELQVLAHNQVVHQLVLQDVEHQELPGHRKAIEFISDRLAASLD